MSSTSFMMASDLSDLCRVCLQLPEESQYLDLTTIYDEDDNLTYGECFTICTQIDLSAGEGIPHNLCKPCGLELQMSYDFHKKVEESKRVIQQCQRQIEENKTILQKELSDSAQESKLRSHSEQEGGVSLMDDKCIISRVEEPTPHQESVSQHEHLLQPSDADEVTGIDVINKICHVKCTEQDETENDDTTHLYSKNEGENADIEEHLEMEDYQNLEALEEEETETLQIKCGENTVPVTITKYKCNEYDEDEEYVEYTEEEEEEEEVVDEGKEVEEFVSCSQELNEDSDGTLTWQENVVAVANKEHLPVETEEDDELYQTDYKKNESYEVLNDSSQDEGSHSNTAVNKEKESNKNGVKKAQGNAKTGTRKRHVGSYSCDYCQRVYPNYSRMMSHRRCHEADRPKFTCSFCGRMYATKQAMECHIQTAHEKSGYACNICDKVFAIRKSLEIHIRYHTGDFPYSCKLCDKKFAQACHLNTHVNVKHNSVRFSCEYPDCGKFFTSSTSLRNHEYTHGIMPFECEYCQRGYPAKSKLRIHIKRKHGMDLNKDQLENMRKFHVMRSKVNLVKVIEP